jgi:hypothetical protein
MTGPGASARTDDTKGVSASVPWGPGVVVILAVLAVAVGWFLLYDAWWLNSDGSSYLSVGKSFVDGHGFRLPNGDALAWWDRPAYPVLITAPWFVKESLEASIWMSRIPLIVVAPIVTAGVLKLTRSLVAAAVAGVVAIAQPWTLLAGGSNLVPDGLMSMAIVAGVLAATLAVTVRRGRIAWIVVSVLAILLATATKETGAIGFLLIAIVLWAGFAKPKVWMIVTALVATVPVVVAALIVVNGSTSSGLLDLPGDFVDRLRDEVFAGSGWIVVPAVVALLLLIWAIPRATEPLPLAGLVLLPPALALGLYASGSGLGMRNAALLPYGVALLVGAFVGADVPGRVATVLKVGGVVAAAVLVVALVASSDARADRSSDVASRSWDSVPTRSVADFLKANRDGRASACTLQFCSFYWLAADGRLDLDLLPQYSARLGPDTFTGLDWSQESGFRGPKAATPPCTDRPLVVTKSDERFGTVFECALIEYVRTEKPRYLVVSGWGGADTFDAGRLIPYLESNPAFRRVFSTPPEAWPRAVAVYEVVGDPQPMPYAPTYYSAAAAEGLPGDHGKAGAVVLDGACYAQAIQQILARPPGSTPSGGAMAFPACATTLG